MSTFNSRIENNSQRPKIILHVKKGQKLGMSHDTSMMMSPQNILYFKKYMIMSPKSLIKKYKNLKIDYKCRDGMRKYLSYWNNIRRLLHNLIKQVEKLMKKDKRGILNGIKISL